MREVEKWVTFHGRRIPIFKKDEIKPLDKKELAKKIYKAADGTYMLDLPNGYSTSYGTNYIQAKTRKDVTYELDNFVSPDKEVQKTIKGFQRPEGNPELRGYGKYDGRFVEYKYDDYKSKSDFERDLRANGIKNIHIKDKRDDYIIQHTNNYGSMNQIYNEYLQVKKLAQKYPDGTTFKEDANELKQIIDKANKVYLQKQKKYKFKK